MKMPKIGSMALLAFALTMVVFAQRPRSVARAQVARMSNITGVVLDRNNARIAGATIMIENDQINRKLRSSDEGKFATELPAGEYRITAEREGFHKFELPAFRANAGVSELIKIRMRVKPPRGLLKVD
jgi:hypothetical protein